MKYIYEVADAPIEDVKKLIDILQRLATDGNSIIVIEHNWIKKLMTVSK